MAGMKKGIHFYITISYLASFLAIRLLVILAGSAESEFADAARWGLLPEIDFYIGRNIILFGYHIHHFYLGILLICLAGWLSIVESRYFSRRYLAVIYGAGLGLFMDEIGLLLTWGDYYSSTTYLLSMLLAVIFLNLVFFPFFWREVRSNLDKVVPTHSFWGFFLRQGNLLEVMDRVSERAGRTEKFSLFFAGLIYICVGVLILLYPRFVYYWVAGGFFLQGVSSLVRAWTRQDRPPTRDGIGDRDDRGA